MRRTLLAQELVLRGAVHVSLDDLLDAGLGAYGLAGELRGHVGLQGAQDEVVRDVKARVQVEGAHDGLVDVLERGVHAARPGAALGLAHEDERGQAQLLCHRREHLARDERDLELRELALVHAREALEEVGGHHGPQDGVSQELEAFVGG